MTNKHMKRCSPSIIIRVIQVKDSYYLKKRNQYY